MLTVCALNRSSIGRNWGSWSLQTRPLNFPVELLRTVLNFISSLQQWGWANLGGPFQSFSNGPLLKNNMYSKVLSTSSHILLMSLGRPVSRYSHAHAYPVSPTTLTRTKEAEESMSCTLSVDWKFYLASRGHVFFFARASEPYLRLATMHATISVPNATPLGGVLFICSTTDRHLAFIFRAGRKRRKKSNIIRSPAI